MRLNFTDSLYLDARTPALRLITERAMEFQPLLLFEIMERDSSFHRAILFEFLLPYNFIFGVNHVRTSLFHLLRSRTLFLVPK
jgi:hypothetical protein